MIDIVDRLRGVYDVPINDGGGPLDFPGVITAPDGTQVLRRTFQAFPIQHEAADLIEKLRAVVRAGDRVASCDCPRHWCVVYRNAYDTARKAVTLPEAPAE